MSDQILGGRYLLGEPIGRGGMAVVWHATDRTLGRQVAVKTLDLTGPDRDVAAARFEREARATASLNHPNIVTVFDTGVDGDTAYLVMELLEGPTLAQRINTEGPLPIRQVETIAGQVLSAMQAADARGIVHRDIKPGNIAFGRDGQAKVLDFGITQLLDDTAGQALTKTNTIVGTAEYLSPEQATGSSVDTRADLYAVGCVLYACLTGKPPFQAATPVATLMKHVNEPAPDVRAARADTPPALAGLIAALLAKDPAVRPASASAAVQMLRSGQSSAPATQVMAAGPAATEVLRPATSVMPAAAGPAGSHPASGPRTIDHEPDRRGFPWPWLLLAIVLLGGGAYVVGNMLGDASQTPNAGRTTGTTPPAAATVPPTQTQTSATSSPVTTTSTTTTPPPSTTSQPPVASTTDTAAPDAAREATTAALQEMRAAVTGASANGGIDTSGIDTLTSAMNAVEQAIPQKAKDVQDAVDALGEDITSLTADGAITEQATAELTGPYAQLKAAAQQVKNGKG